MSQIVITQIAGIFDGEGVLTGAYLSISDGTSSIEVGKVYLDAKQPKVGAVYVPAQAGV